MPEKGTRDDGNRSQRQNRRDDKEDTPAIKAKGKDHDGGSDRELTGQEKKLAEQIDAWRGNDERLETSSPVDDLTAQLESASASADAGNTQAEHRDLAARMRGVETDRPSIVHAAEQGLNPYEVEMLDPTSTRTSAGLLDDVRSDLGVPPSSSGDSSRSVTDHISGASGTGLFGEAKAAVTGSKSGAGTTGAGTTEEPSKYGGTMKVDKDDLTFKDPMPKMKKEAETKEQPAAEVPPGGEEEPEAVPAAIMDVNPDDLDIDDQEPSTPSDEGGKSEEQWEFQQRMNEMAGYTKISPVAEPRPQDPNFDTNFGSGDPEEALAQVDEYDLNPTDEHERPFQMPDELVIGNNDATDPGPDGRAYDSDGIKQDVPVIDASRPADDDLSGSIPALQSNDESTSSIDAGWIEELRASPVPVWLDQIEIPSRFTEGLDDPDE